MQLQVQWSSAPVVGYFMGCPHSCKKNRSAHICLIGLATVCQFCGMWLQMWEHVELCITTGQSRHHHKLPCMLIYLEATVLCRELPTLSLLFFSLILCQHNDLRNNFRAILWQKPQQWWVGIILILFPGLFTVNPSWKCTTPDVAHYYCLEFGADTDTSHHVWGMSEVEGNRNDTSY